MADVDEMQARLRYKDATDRAAKRAERDHR
jgi:hypothetical protein